MYEEKKPLRLFEAVDKVIVEMKPGEELSLAEFHKRRCVASGPDAVARYPSGSGATTAALSKMVDQGKLIWVALDRSRRTQSIRGVRKPPPLSLEISDRWYPRD